MKYQAATTYQGRQLARRIQPSNWLVLAILASGLAGCSNAKTPDLAGLNCLNDSAHCIKQRATTLKALNQDKQRKWIKQPSSAQAYASGVRLFAYRQNLSKLTCSQLAHGRREAAGASGSLRTPGSGLSPAQISRGVMLAKDVGRDLTREYGRRCKTTHRGSG